MTHRQVNKLHSGDEVYWSDPDEGATSRVYTIRTLKVIGKIVVLEDFDGSSLDCFAKELS